MAALSQPIDHQDCLSDWRREKPSKLHQPLEWAKRKIRLKLGDVLNPLGLRVVERVDFTSLRRNIQAAHILDVGVAGGTPSLYARFPDAQLDLFEPARAHFAAIEQQVISKRNARLHRVAVSDQNGFGVLSRAGDSGATLLPTIPHNSAHANGQPVVIRRLDSILNSNDIKRPSLLKIDTEGTELAVLKGAAGIMDAIDTIVVEVQFRRSDTHQPHEVMQFLSSHGFILTDILDREVIQARVACTDFVFERLPAF